MTSFSTRLQQLARMLSTTLFVALLYILLQNFELELMDMASRRGWLTGNIAESLTNEAQQVAELSEPIEARLDRRHREQAWMLGIQLGYASEMIGSYGLSDPKVQEKIRQGLSGILNHASQLAEMLGIGLVDIIPVRTAKEFADLRQRIENDELGIGAKIEMHVTPRARHLFLLGMHVGVEMASYDSKSELVASPAGKEIARHAVLAGLPDQLWRPLTIVSSNDKSEAKKSYQQAILELDSWLMAH